MSYKKDIISKLNEVKEELPSKIAKSSSDIVSAYNSTLSKMKGIANLGDDEAEELASAAISNAVKEEGVLENNARDIRTIEDIEAGEEDYEEELKIKQDMEETNKKTPKISKKIALLKIKDELESFLHVYEFSLSDDELQRITEALRGLVSIINLSESKIKITKAQLNTLIESKRNK
jgi:hypothetical protein